MVSSVCAVARFLEGVCITRKKVCLLHVLPVLSALSARLQSLFCEPSRVPIMPASLHSKTSARRASRPSHKGKCRTETDPTWAPLTNPWHPTPSLSAGQALSLCLTPAGGGAQMSHNRRKKKQTKAEPTWLPHTHTAQFALSVGSDPPPFIKHPPVPKNKQQGGSKESDLAQRKRAGLITRRSLDRNE